MKLSFLIVCLILPVVSIAAAKDKFIAVVVKQCKVTEEQAKLEITPGRSGTVIRFMLCPQKNITLKSGCILTCKSEGTEL
jgi:hypothetical protein